MSWQEGKRWSKIEEVYAILPSVGLELVLVGGVGFDGTAASLLLRERFPECFFPIPSTEEEEKMPIWVLKLAHQVFWEKTFPSTENNWFAPSLEALKQSDHFVTSLFVKSLKIPTYEVIVKVSNCDDSYLRGRVFWSDKKRFFILDVRDGDEALCMIDRELRILVVVSESDFLF